MLDLRSSERSEICASQRSLAERSEDTIQRGHCHSAWRGDLDANRPTICRDVDNETRCGAASAHAAVLSAPRQVKIGGHRPTMAKGDLEIRAVAVTHEAMGYALITTRRSTAGSGSRMISQRCRRSRVLATQRSDSMSRRNRVVAWSIARKSSSVAAVRHSLEQMRRELEVPLPPSWPFLHPMIFERASRFRLTDLAAATPVAQRSIGGSPHRVWVVSVEV